MIKLDRYKVMTENNYVYDKRIFIGLFIIVAISVLVIFQINSWNFNVNPYFKCTEPACTNPYSTMEECVQRLNILWVIPLYKTKDCREECDWCKEPILEMGEYGTPPPLYFQLTPLIFLILAIGGLLLNHRLYNKNRMFDLEIVVSKNRSLNFRNVIRRLNEKSKDNKQE